MAFNDGTVGGSGYEVFTVKYSRDSTLLTVKTSAFKRLLAPTLLNLLPNLAKRVETVCQLTKQLSNFVVC